MPSTTAREDLGYVRDLVERSERNAFPAGIAYLWAAIGLVGFSLIDLAPERVGLYWSIAAPVGFLLSAWLGSRRARTAGQLSARDGRSQMLHWGGLMVAIFLLYPLMAQGALQGEAIAQVILLFVALGYFLAGVHLIPALKWAALAMTIGYVVTITMDGFAWTTLGVLFAVGLVISARVAGGEGGKQPA
ncbi:MAG: hypothetical protein ACR2L6_05160 [Gemmatimonadaceae bacterium]